MQPEESNVGGGQFGQAIGGADALRSAMQRRGIDASVLDQVSPAAPTGPSPAPQGVPEQTGGTSPIPTTPQAPQSEPEVQPRSREMEIALNAMQDVIKTENKIAESIIGLR